MSKPPLLLQAFAVAFLAASSPLAPGVDHLRTEYFDRDPGWDAQNNRPTEKKAVKVVEDFGYSPTRHAMGKSAGEIGGRIVRSSRSASYRKPLPRIMSLDEPLQSSGRFVVMQTGGMSSLYLGWFNSQTFGRISYETDSLRLRLIGESNGCEVGVGLTTSGGQGHGVRATGAGPRGAKVRDFNRIPVKTVYTYDFRYDPAGNSGSGRITFSLGGDGPHTVKDVIVDVAPKLRQAGARFDSFGIFNSKAQPGSALVAFFDDLTLNGEPLSFDEDPGWVGQNNRATFDDDFKRGIHDFGYQPQTQHAGGKPGEIGGMIFSDKPAFYGAKTGRLTFDNRLVASGRLALTDRGPEAGFYLGWFNSSARGYPPVNILGVFAEGPSSVGSMFRPIYAASDPKIGGVLKKGPPIDAFGTPHTWKIEYDPKGAGGNGELRVTFDGHVEVLALTNEARRQNAVFDRFGLAVYEGGGQWSTVYLDDLEYSAGE